MYNNNKRFENKIMPIYTFFKISYLNIILSLVNMCLKEFENEIISRMDQMLMEGGKGDGMYKVSSCVVAALLIFLSVILS